MKKILMTSIFSSMLAFPAFAQMSSEDMTCAEFMAMDSSAQMEAISATASDSMASDDMAADDMAADDMAADDMAADDMAVTAESVAAVCADNPEMTVHDAMTQAMKGN